MSLKKNIKMNRIKLSLLLLVCSGVINSVYAIDPENEEKTLNYQVDLKGWVTFSNSLKKCKVSEFRLPSPLLISAIGSTIQLMNGKNMKGKPYTQQDINGFIHNSYQIYKIEGWKDSKCNVTIKEIPDPVPPPTEIKELLQDLKFDNYQNKITCSFTKKDLPIIVQSSKRMAEIAITPQKFDTNTVNFDFTSVLNSISQGKTYLENLNQEPSTIILGKSCQ